MGNKDHHHHKVSSFNPTWCLRPPPTTPRYTNNNNNGNKSPLPSSRRHKKSHSRNSSSEVTVEPTSPRVGCMGQIRRHKPPSGSSVHSSSTSSSSPSPHFKMFMLKRDASGSSVTTTGTSVSSSSSSASPSVITGEFSLLMLKRVSSSRVSYKEMDPPRSVERKEAKPKDSVSLWKRRCAGGGGLQVQLQAMEQISV